MQSEYKFILRYPNFNYTEILSLLLLLFLFLLYNQHTFTIIHIIQIYKILNITD